MEEHVPVSTEAVEEPPALPSLPKRIVDVLFNPGRLMEGLAVRPAWGGALVVSALLVVLQMVLIPTEVWDAYFRELMIQQGQSTEAVAIGGSMMRISGMIGGAVMIFVMAFLLTGLVTLIFAFILGDEGRYRQYLAVVSHGWLIPALVGLALVPLKITTQNPQFTLNMGAFFFFLPDGYLLKVFTALDLSQIWCWLVVAQGVHAIDKRRSFASAAAILLAMTVLLAMAFAPFIPDA